jgi:cellulose biosynthesis protein BcsQ
MEPLKHIVIADPDIEYIKSYEEDLVIRFRDRATIQIITEAEYLENYFRLHRDIDVLLIAMEFYGTYLKEHNISHMMIVNEKKSVDSETENASFNVMSYRSKEELFDFVENGLSSESEQIEFSEIEFKKEKAQVKVVSVYSPAGGSGKSLASIAIAKKLKKLGETVLVIGCDDMQSFGVFLDTRENADPELALRLREISENTYWSVLKNIYMGDIAYLLPFEKPLSALGIGSEQLFDLINLLKEKKDFSYIVLDLGSALNKEVQTLMSISDICVFIAESKMSSCRMMEKFMMNMELVSVQKAYTIANQYRTEGFRLENDNLFGSFAGYETAEEAMEDPVFYRLALEITG